MVGRGGRSLAGLVKLHVAILLAAAADAAVQQLLWGLSTVVHSVEDLGMYWELYKIEMLGPEGSFPICF